MKTKEQILKEKLNKSENFEVNYILDTITEGLSARIKQGYNSYEYVFSTGSYNAAKEMSKQVAARLNEMGFYARFGWRETTPNGNERPIVVVMLERPPRVPVWKKGVFWFCAIASLLVAMLVYHGLKLEGVI